MILGTRHTGLVVRDIEKSLRFYAETLGLRLVQRIVETGPGIENVLGLNGVKIEWAKLEADDGSVLELLQYHSHPDKGTGGNYPSNRHGCSHIAFNVDNLDYLYEILTEKGIHCNCEPQMSTDGKVKLIYCHDPDGIILEMVESLEKKNSR
jgi:catechol 2,3-dioxygenase-like lactoylglutathione lyase family enzyme